LDNEGYKEASSSFSTLKVVQMLLTYLFPGYEVMVDSTPVTEEGINAPSLGCLLTLVCD